MRDEEVRAIERRALEGDARALADLRAAWRRMDIDQALQEAKIEAGNRAVWLPEPPKLPPGHYQAISMSVEAISIPEALPANATPNGFPSSRWEVVSTNETHTIRPAFPPYVFEAAPVPTPAELEQTIRAPRKECRVPRGNLFVCVRGRRSECDVDSVDHCRKCSTKEALGLS